MEGANKQYESRLKNGVAHPDGPRRTTLAAGFLNAIVQAKLDAAEPAIVQQIKFYDEIAGLTKSPTIAEQQVILTKLLASYTTAKKMEPEISLCQFFPTKKPGTGGKKRYYMAIEFSPSSPLRHVVEFVRVCLQAAGAIPIDGPPPMGPIIRDIPRYK